MKTKRKRMLSLLFLVAFFTAAPTQHTRVNIIIKTNPPGALLYFNNQFKGSTNESGRIVIPDVEFGEHQVKVSKDGYKEVSKTIEVDTLKVFFEIELKKALTVVLITCSIGDADVYADGVFKGKTNSTSGNFFLETGPGTIRLKVEKKGYKTFEGPIDTSLGGRFAVNLIKTNNIKEILMYVLIGIVGAIVLVLLYILLKLLSGRKTMGRFGDYFLLKAIGKGGMSAIYKAKNINTKQLVALKVMDASLMHDKELVTKFFSEGKLISEINKEFPDAPVIQVYEYGRDRVKTMGIPYIAMEFFDGTSLSKIITSAKIGLKEKLYIVMEIAKALTAAHQLGIFHKDITPENILIKEKQVRLIDFGIAEEEEVDSNEEINNSITGKPIYMSPEQCAGESVNGKSDIYSLGVIFYFFVVGQPPFEAKNHLEVMKMHQESPVPAIESENIPPDLSAIITAMLDKDPTLRPSAHQLYENLKKFTEQQE